MTIHRTGLAALAAVLISAPLHAGTLQFGVIGSPIDMSANVSEAILPGANGNVFQRSMPLFGTQPDPKQTSELLHLSSVGVNPSPHSSVSGAFASSLTESDGNGGVGVSQLIFGLPNPDGTDQNVTRQLVAQSLWTQTFVYTGTPTVDLSLHLRIPALQVELWGHTTESRQSEFHRNCRSLCQGGYRNHASGRHLFKRRQLRVRLAGI